MRIACILLLFAAACAPAMSAEPDSDGSGTYPAVMEQDPSLATHTIYRPKDLNALQNRKLPIIAWGNGACVNAGNRFRNFLTEIASHGFLAIAIGPIADEKDPSKTPLRSPAAEKAGPKGPATMSSQLLDAITWAVGENRRAASQYYGKLDPSKIAVMGQSCGGVQTLAVAADPQIQLLGIWNSGLLKPESKNASTPAMEDVPKEQLEKLHCPIFYFTGDQANDVAYPNGLDDFQRITTVPAFHAYKEGLPHAGTYREPNGGELGKIAVALLEWQLKADKEAAKMFVGPNCGLCQDPKWHVSKKNME